MTRTLIVAGLLLPAVAFGGKKDKNKVDPDHANHFKTVQPAGEHIKVGVTDAWARDAEAKMKVTFHNDTPDFVLVDTTRSKFVFTTSEYVPRGGKRWLVVQPGDKKSRVFKTEGSGMHQESMIFAPGGLALVPKNAPAQRAPDFRLPLDNSEFDAGGFHCAVPGRVKQETDETKLTFKCRYQGEGVGIVNPRKIQVRLEDGQTFANDNRKMDHQIVQPGDEFKLDAVFHVSHKIVDMQFATMYVVFNETFREGTPREVTAEPIALTLDPGLTAAKND